jgi:hypothetical protein
MQKQKRKEEEPPLLRSTVLLMNSEEWIIIHSLLLIVACEQKTKLRFWNLLIIIIIIIYEIISLKPKKPSQTGFFLKNWTEPNRNRWVWTGFSSVLVFFFKINLVIFFIKAKPNRKQSPLFYIVMSDCNCNCDVDFLYRLLHGLDFNLVGPVYDKFCQNFI